MIYDTLVEILSQNMPSMVVGRSLFINQAPADQPLAGLFRDGAGGIVIDGYIPTERSGIFAFVLRGKDEAQIKELMQEAMALLTINGKLHNQHLIKVCRPLTEPISYRISVGNLREISVNFSINYGIVQ